MQFEVIRKSHKKKAVIGSCIFVAIVGVLLVRNSFAKYQTIKSFKIVDGVINYTYNPADFDVIAMYKNDGGEDIAIDSVPGTGYVLNSDKSYCEKMENDGSKLRLNDVTLEYKNGKMYFGNVSQKGTKCYLYFNIYNPISAKETILANVTINNRTPDFSNPATTDEGVYFVKDETGNDSYYFRGAVENNYVRFAGFYWRIIRINGDGTIRLIYDGTSARKNGTSSSATQIGTLAFNSNYDNNMYLGFMYTNGNVHGLGTKSNILSSTNIAGLETWYKSNLLNYDNNIDMGAGFCGDRTLSSGTGIGTTTTEYKVKTRLATTAMPSLACQKEDYYTMASNKITGNGALAYPIGLISADEVTMAGGVVGVINQNYYLYTGQSYWTMSPNSYGSPTYARMFNVWPDGKLNYDPNVSQDDGVRPVINLKADTTFTFSGTGEKGSMTNPYVVQ